MPTPRPRHAHRTAPLLRTRAATGTEPKKKNRKKGKKGKKGGEDDDDGAGGGAGEFEINVKDERFSSVFTDPNFALDPTVPQFRQTPGLGKLLGAGEMGEGVWFCVGRERGKEAGGRAGEREKGRDRGREELKMRGRGADSAREKVEGPSRRFAPPFRMRIPSLVERQLKLLPRVYSIFSN